MRNKLIFVAYLILITFVINIGMTIHQDIAYAKEVKELYLTPSITPTLEVVMIIPTVTVEPTVIITPEPIITDSRDKVKTYITNNFPASPMISEIDFIFDNLDNERAIRLFAIAGTESGFGTNGFVATDCNNYFGYLYYGTARRGCYSPRWNNPHNAISRYIILEENGWLASDNHKGYCVTGCEDWDSSYNYFKSLFK